MSQPRAKHYRYLDTIRKIARSGWGRDFLTQQDATEDMANDIDKRAAFATVEIVRGLHQFALAFAQQHQNESVNLFKPGNNSKRFEGIRPGERLYDAEDGVITEFVVLSATEDGLAIVMPLGKEHYYKPEWATTWHHRTKKEAIAAWVKSEQDYHSPRLKFAQGLADALASGKADEYLEQNEPPE